MSDSQRWNNVCSLPAEQQKRENRQNRPGPPICGTSGRSGESQVVVAPYNVGVAELSRYFMAQGSLLRSKYVRRSSCI
jgi:hypothetical protein